QAGKALIPILKLLNTMIQAGIHAFSLLHPAIKGVLATGLQLGMFALVLNGVYRSLIMLKTGLTVLKMFIPALKAFRLAFLASPIGIILALASALYLLYDDWKTWQEGGKSLIDWSKWTGGFDKVMKKIKDFLALLEKVKVILQTL
ncbi:MAG: phage tail tape measure protein, partial [Acinetobacter sp.]